MATIYSLSNLSDNLITLRITASDVALANIRQVLRRRAPSVVVMYVYKERQGA
jgi:hypothetical protein